MGRPLCTICLSEGGNEDVYEGINACGHVFHQHCLQQWYEYKQKCPSCKISYTRPRGATRLYLTYEKDGTGGLQHGHSSPRIPCSPNAAEQENLRDFQAERNRLVALFEFEQAECQRLSAELKDKEDILIDVRSRFEKVECELEEAKLERIRSRQEYLRETNREKVRHSDVEKMLRRSQQEVRRLKERNMELEAVAANQQLKSDMDMDIGKLRELAEVISEGDKTKKIVHLETHLHYHKVLVKEQTKECRRLSLLEDKARKAASRAEEKLKTANRMMMQNKARIEELEGSRKQMLQRATSKVESSEGISRLFNKRLQGSQEAGAVWKIGSQRHSQGVGTLGAPVHIENVEGASGGHGRGGGSERHVHLFGLLESRNHGLSESLETYAEPREQFEKNRKDFLDNLAEDLDASESAPASQEGAGTAKQCDDFGRKLDETSELGLPDNFCAGHDTVHGERPSLQILQTSQLGFKSPSVLQPSRLSSSLLSLGTGSAAAGNFIRQGPDGRGGNTKVLTPPPWVVQPSRFSSRPAKKQRGNDTGGMAKIDTLFSRTNAC